MMGGQQSAQGFAADERSIGAQDKNVALIILKVIGTGKGGVPCAQLLVLLDPGDAFIVGEGGNDLVFAVPDDNHDLGATSLIARPQDVPEHRSPADLMKRLRATAFHAGELSRGEDDCCYCHF